MSTAEILLKTIYKKLSDDSRVTDIDAEPLRAEKDCLESVNDVLTATPDDLILLALKSELLVHLEPEASRTISELVIEKTFADESESAKLARGIGYYVGALHSDGREDQLSTPETLNLFRLSLENFPNHWNSPAMFADHVLDFDDLYDEAVGFIENAVQGNTEPTIIRGLLKEAAYISHMTRRDADAVNYYERLDRFSELSASENGHLALSCARIKRFRKAHGYFYLSWNLEKKQEADLRRENPSRTTTYRGYPKKILWKLTEQIIGEYENNSGDGNLILIGMCFKYLPAMFSSFVLDSIREELSGKSDLADLMKFFQTENDLGLGREEKQTDGEFINKAAYAVRQLNRKLKEMQKGKSKIFQVPERQIKNFIEIK